MTRLCLWILSTQEVNRSMLLSLQFHTSVFCSVRLWLGFSKLHFIRLPVRFCHSGAVAGHQEAGGKATLCFLPLPRLPAPAPVLPQGLRGWHPPLRDLSLSSTKNPLPSTCLLIVSPPAHLCQALSMVAALVITSVSPFCFVSSPTPVSLILYIKLSLLK